MQRSHNLCDVDSRAVDQWFGTGLKTSWSSNQQAKGISDFRRLWIDINVTAILCFAWPAAYSDGFDGAWKPANMST